jgi:hypothetical protein
MRRSALTTLALLIPVLPALPALAREVSEGNTFVLSAERLTGVEHADESETGGSRHQTSIYLLGTLQSSTPFDMPRLALDYVTSAHVTVGAAATYYRLSASIDDPTLGSASSSANFLVLSPRIGGIFALSPAVTFWGRAGVTYYDTWVSSSSQGQIAIVTPSRSGVGLDLEAMLIFRVTDHFGISASALADIGLTGKQTAGNNSQDDKFSNYGGSAGLVGWF